VLNQYIFQLDRYGAHGNFTDAIYPLAEAHWTSEAGHADDHIYVIDWGFPEALTFLGRGKPTLFAAADAFLIATPDSQQQNFISKIITDPQGLFVGHVRGREVFMGVDERLVAAAGISGYRKEIVRTIFDSNKRAVFQIFRMRKVSL